MLDPVTVTVIFCCPRYLVSRLCWIFVTITLQIGRYKTANNKHSPVVILPEKLTAYWKAHQPMRKEIRIGDEMWMDLVPLGESERVKYFPAKYRCHEVHHIEWRDGYEWIMGTFVGETVDHHGARKYMFTIEGYEDAKAVLTVDLERLDIWWKQAHNKPEPIVGTEREPLNWRSACVVKSSTKIPNGLKLQICAVWSDGLREWVPIVFLREDEDKLSDDDVQDKRYPMKLGSEVKGKKAEDGLNIISNNNDRTTVHKE